MKYLLIILLISIVFIVAVIQWPAPQDVQHRVVNSKTLLPSSTVIDLDFVTWILGSSHGEGELYIDRKKRIFRLTYKGKDATFTWTAGPSEWGAGIYPELLKKHILASIGNEETRTITFEKALKSKSFTNGVSLAIALLLMEVELEPIAQSGGMSYLAPEERNILFIVEQNALKGILYGNHYTQIKFKAH